MHYPELKKLYYEDEAQYKAAYDRRFSGETAVHPDFAVSKNPAFFIQTGEIIQTAYEILRLDKEISFLCRDLPGIALKQYSRKCLIDEIVLSNNIEGVHSSRKEIGEVLMQLEDQSRQRKKENRFFGLVNKYMKLGKSDDIPLRTCADIRALYDELVLPEILSEDRSNKPDGKFFRKELSSVYNAAGKIIHNGLSPESAIIENMEKALSFLHDGSVEELYRICLFHYMFEYIHPFYDGNGRIGRFILSFCVSKCLCPLLSYRLSETIKENIRDYYQAFASCNDPRNLGDLTPFLLMMLTMIKTASVDLRDSLKRRSADWAHYKKALALSCPDDGSAVLSKITDLLVQASLFSENGISTQELIRYSHLTYATVKKYLKQIEQRGLLLSEKEGKEKFYTLDLSLLD